MSLYQYTCRYTFSHYNLRGKSISRIYLFSIWCIILINRNWSFWNLRHLRYPFYEIKDVKNCLRIISEFFYTIFDVEHESGRRNCPSLEIFEINWINWSKIADFSYIHKNVTEKANYFQYFNQWPLIMLPFLFEINFCLLMCNFCSPRYTNQKFWTFESVSFELHELLKASRQFTCNNKLISVLKLNNWIVKMWHGLATFHCDYARRDRFKWRSYTAVYGTFETFHGPPYMSVASPVWGLAYMSGVSTFHIPAVEVSHHLFLLPLCSQILLYAHVLGSVLREMLTKRLDK